MNDDFDFFNGRCAYDPISGHLLAKVPMNGYGGAIPVGSILGSVQEGRVKLSVRRGGKQRVYNAHRVCWLLRTGEWPPGEVDHVDTDATNNSWSNLRLANRSQNTMNRNKQSNNTSGFKGVTKHGTGWRAQIWKQQRSYPIGTYRTKEAAHEAYCRASAELHGDFGRT